MLCYLWAQNAITISGRALGLAMAAKTVALDTEAYEMLLHSKRPGETFSEVVRRKFRPATHISDLAGSLSDLPDPVWVEIERERRSHRRSDRARLKRLQDQRRRR